MNHFLGQAPPPMRQLPPIVFLGWGVLMAAVVGIFYGATNMNVTHNGSSKRKTRRVARSAARRSR
jgi:hypothetical protein